MSPCPTCRAMMMRQTRCCVYPLVSRCQTEHSVYCKITLGCVHTVRKRMRYRYKKYYNQPITKAFRRNEINFASEIGLVRFPSQSISPSLSLSESFNVNNVLRELDICMRHESLHCMSGDLYVLYRNMFLISRTQLYRHLLRKLLL